MYLPLRYRWRHILWVDSVQLDTDSESSGIWIVEIGRICSQIPNIFFSAPSLFACRIDKYSSMKETK